jgi:hypothetical protein
MMMVVRSVFDVCDSSIVALTVGGNSGNLFLNDIFFSSVAPQINGRNAGIVIGPGGQGLSQANTFIKCIFAGASTAVVSLQGYDTNIFINDDFFNNSFIQSSTQSINGFGNRFDNPGFNDPIHRDFTLTLQNLRASAGPIQFGDTPTMNYLDYGAAQTQSNFSVVIATPSIILKNAILKNAVLR